MRIISGIFGGRKLVDASALKSLRPTTDRSREALFNILTSAAFLRKVNFSLENAVVLDLCCGTGAVGIEALSRQAKFITFIDNNSKHLEILQQNLNLLKINNIGQYQVREIGASSLNSLVSASCEIIRADVSRLKNLSREYDLVFFDPPYQADYAAMISSILQNCNFSKNSLLVIEHDRMMKLQFLSDALIYLESRSYGKTNFSFFAVNSL